jgi:hypothetical protein
MARSGHGPKNPLERAAYVESVLKPAPTVERPDTQGSNTSTVREQPAEPTVSKRRPINRSVRLSNWLRDHVLQIFGALIVAFISFLGYSYVSLNREVGELKAGATNLERLDKRVDDLKDRLSAAAAKIELMWEEFKRKPHRS